MKEQFFFNKLEITDYDDLIARFRGAELDFKMIGSGNLKSEFLQFGNEYFTVTYAMYNQIFDQAGIAYPDRLAFVIPAADNLYYTWRKYQINNGLMPIFKKKYEIETISPVGFSVFTIAYPDNVLDGILKRYGVVENNFPFSQDIYEINPLNLQAASNSLNSLTKRIIKNPAIINSDEVKRCLLTSVPFTIIDGLGNKRDIKKRNLRRIEALHKIRNYIRINNTSDLNIDSLSRISGISPRSLQIAFQEELGISPLKYIKYVRLNEVRRDLQYRKKLNKNIVDVANKYGFWHMGQFAKDYEYLFGELPSDTVAATTSGA